MIKANELRIGNRVKFLYDEEDAGGNTLQLVEYFLGHQRNR